MIVYGRRNYYKRKSFHRRATCPQCRRDVYLHSYNTTRFFHIARLPLFPLAQLRIFDFCPACNTAMQQPLRQWNRWRRQDLRQAIEKMRKHAANPAPSIEALALATRLGALEEFEQIAAHLAEYHLNNPDVLVELAESYHFFGMPDKGDEAFRRSLAIRDRQPVRQRLLDRAARPPLEAPLPPQPAMELAPLALLPALLIVALAFALHAAFNGAPRHVFFVNGIGRPYEVLVNGEAFHLDPGAPVRFPAGARSWHVQPGTNSPAFDPFEEKVSIPLFNRGNRRRVVILNPDRAGLVLWEQATYRSPLALASGESLPGDRSFYTGGRLYLFENIDAPFTGLPDRLSKGISPESGTLRGLRQVTRPNPTENAFAILENGQRDVAIEYMRQGLRHHPENEDYLILLAALWEPEQALTFLETRLEDRPVLVEWHRYYQEISARYRPTKDILTDYARRYDAEPENRELAYLLGRLIDKPSEARAILESATRPPNPSAHAYHALAFHHMNRGAFAEALENERKALQLLPEKPRFRTLEEEMLLATGNYNELTKRLRSQFASDERNRSVALALASVLALSGETSEARAIAKRHLERTTPGPDEARVTALFEATLAESALDLDLFATASSRVGWGDWPYFSAVARRDFVQAGEMLRKNRSGSWREHLLLYAVAQGNGSEEMARERLQSAIAFLRNGGPFERSAAAWFVSGAPAPGLDEVYRIRSWPTDTRILLTALGTRFPRLQDLYYTAARKMNYDPAFPGLVLHNLLDQSASPTARSR